jgi:hypothetical protein
MRLIPKRLLCAVVIGLLILIPMGTSVYAQSPVMVQEKTAEGMAFDLVVLRPLGLVSTLVGSVMFAAGLIFSIPGDNVEESGQLLMKDPAKFTFGRPLGEF